MSFTYIAESLLWSSATMRQGNKRRIHGFSQLDSANQADEKFLIVLNCLKLHAMCRLSHFLSTCTFSQDLGNLHVLVAAGHAVRMCPCAGISPHSGQSRQSSIREIVHISDPHMTNITCLAFMAQSFRALPFGYTSTTQSWAQNSLPFLHQEGARNYFQYVKSSTIHRCSPHTHMQ